MINKAKGMRKGKQEGTEPKSWNSNKFHIMTSVNTLRNNKKKKIQAQIELWPDDIFGTFYVLNY